MPTSDENDPRTARDISHEAELRWAEDARARVRGERRTLRSLAAVRAEIALGENEAAPTIHRSKEGERRS